MTSASPDELMRQACATAGLYMGRGKKEIDELFGAGYANAHPELLIAYMNTAAIDFGTGIFAKVVSEGLERLSLSLEN